MVEVEGERVLAASCIRTPTPGWDATIYAAPPELTRKVKEVLE